MIRKLWLIACLGVTLPVWAQGGDGVVDTSIQCDSTGGDCQGISARLELADAMAADLNLRFENASGLTLAGLEVSAELVDPRDPQVRNRMPAGTFIPDDFPVLVTINPAAGSGLSYQGRFSLELVTENLEFSSHTPYRLFHAPVGGQFQDISQGLGSGSLRVLGLSGDFSEFAIASDLRPIDRVIGRKLDRIDALLTAEGATFPAVSGLLQGLLDQARQSFESGDLSAAIETLTQLSVLIRQSAGQIIPDVSTPGQAAAAGRLRAAAATLRLSLTLGQQAQEEGMGSVTQRIVVDEELSVELALSFEESFVIDPEDLDVEAELIDVHAPALLARMPPGVHVPEEFPVLLRVNAEASSDQAFSGMFEIEIVTDNLNFLGGTPMRLFKAPDGGAFEDITSSLGLGSLRVLGLSGDFSEFVIASDLRPLTDVIGRKLERLAQFLEQSSSAIPSSVEQELTSLIDSIGQSVEQGLDAQALSQLDELLAAIRSNAGENIPSVWRPSEPNNNVAGELGSIAGSLRFSLGLQMAPITADPADVNRDGQVDVGDVLQLIDRVFGQP